jgi:hypothetical protein
MENSPLSPGLRIGEMRLRVPGQDAGVGQRIAQHTGELLAAGSAGLTGRHLGAMRVRVTATPGASEAEIARAVSRAIVARLTSSSDA